MCRDSNGNTTRSAAKISKTRRQNLTMPGASSEASTRPMCGKEWSLWKVRILRRKRRMFAASKRSKDNRLIVWYRRSLSSKWWSVHHTIRTLEIRIQIWTWTLSEPNTCNLFMLRQNCSKTEMRAFAEIMSTTSRSGSASSKSMLTPRG